MVKYILIFICSFLASCGKNHNVMEQIIKPDNESAFYLKPHMPSPFGKEFSNSIKLINGQFASESIMVDGVLYSISKGLNVSAYSIKERKFLWSTKIDTGSKFNSYGGGILYAKDRLYITSGSRFMIVLCAKTGVEITKKILPDVAHFKPVIWFKNHVKNNSKSSESSVKNGVILVQTISNQIIAYNAETLDVLWIHDGNASNITTQSEASPIVINDHVLVCFSSGNISYIKITDGSTTWSYDLASIEDYSNVPFGLIDVTTKPIVANNNVYISTTVGELISINLINGNQNWKKKIIGIQSIASESDKLIITTSAKQVALVNSNNGKIMWVGNIFDTNDKNSTKDPVFLYSPILSIKDSGFSLEVICSNGNVYSFDGKIGVTLPKVASRVFKIAKKIDYYYLDKTTNKIYILNDGSLYLN